MCINRPRNDELAGGVDPLNVGAIHGALAGSLADRGNPAIFDEDVRHCRQIEIAVKIQNSATNDYRIAFHKMVPSRIKIMPADILYQVCGQLLQPRKILDAVFNLLDRNSPFLRPAISELPG
jgi:hypothetical protein